MTIWMDRRRQSCPPHQPDLILCTSGNEQPAASPAMAHYPKSSSIIRFLALGCETALAGHWPWIEIWQKACFAAHFAMFLVTARYPRRHTPFLDHDAWSRYIIIPPRWRAPLSKMSNTNKTRVVSSEPAAGLATMLHAPSAPTRLCLVMSGPFPRSCDG